MPQKMWEFRCCSPEHFWLGRSTCSDCGALGKYDGWHLSMIEMKGGYSRSYGVRPIGEHRKYADKLMGPLFRSCEICAGRGVIGWPGEEGCLRCPLCDGTTRVSRVSRGLLARARQQVLAVYPEAGTYEDEW